MPDNDYVKGMHLETRQGQYGEYIKGSIDTEEIFNNPLNNGKWLNFMMFKSKTGKWYPVNSKPQNQQQTNNVVQFVDEDEIPF